MQTALSLSLVLALGCGGTDPAGRASDALADALARVPTPGAAARRPVLGTATPGNAFDDYAAAAELASAETAPGFSAGLVVIRVVRGASRRSARDPRQSEIGSQAFGYYRAGEVTAEAARAAREDGDLSEAIRYDLALLRYGQDLRGGWLLSTSIGIGIQRRAAKDLRDLVKDARAERDQHLQVVAGIGAILDSMDTPANSLRAAAAGEARAMLSILEAGRGAEKEGPAIGKMAGATRAMAKLVDAVHQAPGWALERPGFVWLTCTMSGIPAASCGLFRDIVSRDTETRELLRSTRRLARARAG